ncbi:unnamed protein product [Rhizophagus irregularis]|nr:unnamed protein product [Rhizophagus irregularis]
MERQKKFFSPSHSKRNNDNLTRPPLFSSELDRQWFDHATKLYDFRVSYFLETSQNKWRKLLSLEKSFNEFDSTYTPSNPSSLAYITRRSDLDNILSRLRSSFSRADKKVFQRTLVKRSTSRGKSDHSSFCPGSTGNSFPPEFTPLAVAPAFMPFDH